MSQYEPDVWVVVEIDGNKVENRYYRVLAGWYGGFANGDSWKMSSGITKIVEQDTYWEIHNTSGSVYQCHKNNEGFSGYTKRVLDNYQLENSDDLRLNHVAFDTFKTMFLLETN